jgi:putative tryptophan/tyrosine transport system substrate-binding protein
MRRRDFIKVIGGVAAAWPLAARGQQDERLRRIGTLERGDETERAVQARRGAMREGLAKLGWIEGRNVQFDIRYSADDPDRLRANADELIRLAPDVIAVNSWVTTRALLQRTQTIPIVFTNVGDPVAGGLLKNIARPEGNATGITNLHQSFGGKWLELLKEAAPRTTRVAFIFAAEIVTDNYLAVMDVAAEILGMKAIHTPYRNAVELERAIGLFAAEPNGSLAMVPPPPSANRRELINRLALKYRLSTIYSTKDGTAEGGMMSYAPDNVETNRISTSYIDRVLRGAKVSDLPVQFPTKYDLVINLKTAKAIGLEIPPTVLALADELIE